MQEALDLAKAAKYDEAIPEFEGFLKARPGIPEAQAGLLECYSKKGDSVKADALAGEILQKDKKNVSALIVRGDALLAKEKWDEAQPFFEQAAAADVKSLEAARGMGLVALGKADLAKAGEWLEKAIKINSDDAKTLLAQSSLLQAQGKGPEALKYLKKADAASGGDPLVVAKMAKIYADQGNLTEAAAAYQKLLKDKPDSLEGLKGMAQIEEAQGKTKEAMEGYEKILKDHPEDVACALALARLYQDAKQTKESTDLLEKFQEKFPNDLSVQTACAQALVEKGEADKALEILNKVLEKDKNFLAAYLGRGAAYVKKGQLDQALQEYQEALKANPKYADGYFALGEFYIGKGMYYEGIQELQKIVEINPRYPHLHYYIGVGFLTGGFADVSIEEFKSEIQANPSNSLAVNNLALAYAKTGKPDEAEKTYTKVLKTDPNNADALYNLALMHAKAGKVPDAVREFEKVLSIKPEDLPSAYNLGILYAKSDQVDKAVNIFKKVVELDANNLDARDNLAVLYERQGKTDEAIAEYQNLLQVPGLESADVVWASIAGLYVKKKDIAKAKEAAQKAIQVNPKSAKGHFQMGAIGEYNDAGEQFGAGFDANASIENYRKAAELDPSLKEALARVDIITQKTSGNATAQVQATALASQTDTMALQVKECVTRGELFFNQGQLNEAQAQWQEALRLDPSNAAAQESLNKLTQLRNADEAKVKQEQAQKSQEEEAENAKKQAEAKITDLLTQGQTSFDASNYDDAIAKWKEVLQLDPGNAVAKMNLESAEKMKASAQKPAEEALPAAPVPAAETPAAEAPAEKVPPAATEAPATETAAPAAQAPAPVEERVQKASTQKIDEGLSSGDLYLDIKDYASAIKEYKKVLDMDPANARAKEKIDQAQKALTAKNEEIKAVEQKKVAHEKNVSGLLTQGEVQFKQGNFDEAIQIWSEILEADPANSVAQDKIAEAKDLKIARDTRIKKEMEAKEFAKQRALVRIKEAQLKQKKEEVSAEGAYRAPEAATAKAPKKKLHLAKKRDAFLDERFLDETLASITSDN